MVQNSSIRGQAWKHLGSVMLVATAASLAVSFLLNYLLLFSEALTPFDRSLITAIAVPLIVALPLSFLLARSWWEVRQYRRELTRSASYDRDTEFFNGAAFASVMDRRAPAAGERKGAFLVVNADAVKSISRQYGPSWGEEALRVVAATIRSSVRSSDIVGRLGDSEFGIYLPGATEENARDVGERIRAGVANVYFAPSDAAHGKEQQPLLNVGVAGVIFEDALKFDRIYSAAEQSLAGAEESVEIAQLGASEGAMPN